MGCAARAEMATVTFLPPQPNAEAQRLGRVTLDQIGRIAALYPEMAGELHGVRGTLAAIMRLDRR